MVTYRKAIWGAIKHAGTSCNKILTAIYAIYV